MTGSGPIVDEIAGMKQRLFLLLVCMLLPGLHASAQKTTTYTELKVIPQNALMVNLGGLALDYLNLGYYHALGANHAIGAYLGYLYHPIGSDRITGYGYGLSYRYYPAAKSLSRFYYSPTIGIQQIEGNSGVHARSTGLLMSALFGWQWFVEQRFAVGLGIGGRIIMGGNNDADPAIQDASGASPIITLDLGYGW
jgi:hypothetical protein